MPERVTTVGDNVTDDTRLEALAACTATYINLQEAAEQAKVARSEHSNTLKVWKGRGVNLEALKKAIKDRFADPAEVLAELHEYTRMRALQNMPNIQQDLAALWGAGVGIDAEHEAQRTRWRDDGALAARNGLPSDDNPHEPGSEAYACYAEGWKNSPERISRGPQPTVNTSRRRRRGSDDQQEAA